MKEAGKSSKQAAQKNGRAAKKTTNKEPTRLLKATDKAAGMTWQGAARWKAPQ